MYFLYVLSDPRIPEDIKYIGITKNLKSRLQQHINSAKRSYPNGNKRENWIGSLLAEQVQPIMFEIDTAETKELIFEKEISLIEELSIDFDLKNGSGGGPGFDVSWPNSSGKSLEELWNDPEWVIFHTNILKEYWSLEENRKKQSQKVTEYFKNPDNKLKVSNALKAYYKKYPAKKLTEQEKITLKSTEGFQRMLQGKKDSLYLEQCKLRAEKQYTDIEARKVSSIHAKRGWDSLSPEERKNRILKTRLGSNFGWAKKHNRVLTLIPKCSKCSES